MDRKEFNEILEEVKKLEEEVGKVNKSFNEMGLKQANCGSHEDDNFFKLEVSHESKEFSKRVKNKIEEILGMSIFKLGCKIKKEMAEELAKKYEDLGVEK